jgi:hypothetical protein
VIYNVSHAYVQRYSRFISCKSVKYVTRTITFSAEVEGLGIAKKFGVAEKSENFGKSQKKTEEKNDLDWPTTGATQKNKKIV